jgi:N-acyl-D-amino-acid deacylase
MKKRQEEMAQYDVKIINGFIINGTGNPGFQGELAVKDGKIARIATRIPGEADKVIDACSQTVCPGFVDPHVHEELAALGGDTLESYLRQGTTTIINGNCGHSVTGGKSRQIYEYMYENGLASGEARRRFIAENPEWEGLKEYAKVLKDKGGVNINMAFLLGHGTIRWCVMGGSKDRKLTKEEMAQMKVLIAQGMKEGAVGISSGLSYIPGRYADTAELVECAKVASKMDGVYASHLRMYDGFEASLAEAIEIGEKANVRVQVSHYSTLAEEGYCMAMKARERGLEIALDTIPKSSGHLKRKDRLIQFIISASTVLFGKGREAFERALRTPEGREEILRSTRFKDQMLIVNTGDSSLEGRWLKDIAKERGITLDELLLDLLEKAPDTLTFWQGGISRDDFSGRPYSPTLANCAILSPGSDRIFGEVFDRTAWYELFRKGAMPIFYQAMRAADVREEEIIRRMTSLPAQQFRLTDRGLLMEGKAADIVILDLCAFSYPDEKQIEYTNPDVMASGVDIVLINGQVAFKSGSMLNTKAGQIIGMYGTKL